MTKPKRKPSERIIQTVDRKLKAGEFKDFNNAHVWIQAILEYLDRLLVPDCKECFVGQVEIRPLPKRTRKVGK